MKITEIIRPQTKARFVLFRNGNFIYRTDTNFEFPIPIEDIAGATLLAEDKALFFMRWIRKNLATIEGAIEEEILEDEKT